MSKCGVKLFRGSYKELTIFLGRLQLRFSLPHTAAWWGDPKGVSQKQLYSLSLGKGHCEDD